MDLFRALCMKVVWPAWGYVTRKLSVVKRGQVLFADAHSETIPFSLERMRQKVLTENYSVIDCVWCSEKCSSAAVFWRYLSFIRLYMTSEYTFVCNYVAPLAVCGKRPGTKLIQLWHTCGIYKKFGFDSAEDLSETQRSARSNPFGKPDLVPVSAAACVPFFESAMRLAPGCCLPLGVSRTDVFFDPEYLQKCKADFEAAYPQYRGKKLLLWAPTFRGAKGNRSQQAEPLPLSFAADEGWTVITKYHPIFQLRDSVDIPFERLLPLASAVVTDYSTVLFEALLLNIPTILFLPDCEAYSVERGLYIEPAKIPVPVVRDGKALAKALESCDRDFDTAAVAAFKQDYVAACDGRSTERIFNHIFHADNHTASAEPSR